MADKRWIKMFTLRQNLDNFQEHNMQTYNLFIYFKATYD